MSASKNLDRTALLVRLCHGKVTRGNGDGSGFKLQVWNRVLVDFNGEAKVLYSKT